MHVPCWAGLIRRIPAAEQEHLVLVTSNGTEIMVNSVVRLERDFMVIRGRAAGSQSGNMVVIIPFDQINFLSFAKKVTDDALLKMLGKPGAAVETYDAQEQVNEEFLVEEATPPPEALIASAESNPNSSAAEAGAAAVANGKAPQVSKSLLLARLRARLAKDGPKAP